MRKKLRCPNPEPEVKSKVLACSIIVELPMSPHDPLFISNKWKAKILPSWCNINFNLFFPRIQIFMFHFKL